MAGTIKDAFEHGMLAWAAYFDLQQNLAGDALESELSRDGRMTSEMAEYISKRYTVYKSDLSNGLTGYQGIIFQGVGEEAGHFILANRGTEGNSLSNAPQDFAVDLFLGLLGGNLLFCI